MERKILSLKTYYNLTLQDIATKIGMSVTTLSRHLNGKGDWDLYQQAVPLWRLFRELGEDISFQDFFEIKE